MSNRSDDYRRFFVVWQYEGEICARCYSNRDAAFNQFTNIRLMGLDCRVLELDSTTELYEELVR